MSSPVNCTGCTNDITLEARMIREYLRMHEKAILADGKYQLTGETDVVKLSPIFKELGLMNCCIVDLMSYVDRTEDVYGQNARD